jgi:hypothetical protein
VLTATSACGSDPQDLRAGEYHVLVSSSAGDEDMGIDGTVQLVGDCLGIGDSVAFWPPGTEIVVEDPLTIEVPGEGEVSVGDLVHGAGGSHATAHDPDISTVLPDIPIPDACPSTSWVDYRPE